MIEMLSIYESYFWRRVWEGTEKGKLTRKVGGGIKFVFNFDDVYQYEVLWLLLY